MPSPFFEYQIERLQANPKYLVKKINSGYQITFGLKTVTVRVGEDKKLYDFLYNL